MRIVKGTVTEILIIRKKVELEIQDMEKGGDDDADLDMISEMVRDKAYEKTISEFQEVHGWEPIETINVDVDWRSKTKGGDDDPVESSG